MAIKGSGDNFSTCSLWFKESSKCSLGESKEGEGGPTKAYLMNDYESEGKLQNSALCVTTVLSNINSPRLVGLCSAKFLLVIVSAQNGTIAHLLSAQT